MAKLIVVSMLVCLAWVVLAEETKYTNKFDNVNLDDILNSDRLLTNYVKCLKGTGKCTPDGTELKRKFREYTISYSVQPVKFRIKK